jgi:hypothetical protein
MGIGHRLLHSPSECGRLLIAMRPERGCQGRELLMTPRQPRLRNTYPLDRSAIVLTRFHR